jgi:hypothetical protein
LGASSVNITVAERRPGARGVNVKVIVQVEFTAIAALQEGLDDEKSLAFAPPTATFVIWSGAVPELETEIFSGVLVPWVTVPKSRLPGTRVTAGPWATPVPLN